MIVDSAYYIQSMLKVYAVAALVTIVFPMFVWKNYLKPKQFSYRFMFCLVTQNVYCISLVLLLGILQICSVYTVLAGLALELALVRWKYPAEKRQTRRPKDYVRAGSLLKKEQRRLIRKRLGRLLSKLWQGVRSADLWPYLARNWFSFAVLLAALVYNAYFLNYNVNQSHSFQFSDIPVHQSWVYDLEHGTLFSAGIYPFGMHSMIYVIRVLSGINLREIMLYFGSYQTLMLMLCMYCVARRIFRVRYIALLPVVFFSMLLNNGRYAAALPQECGVFAMMTLMYFMIGFLRTPLEKHDIKSDPPVKRFFRINQYFFKRYITSDALMVMLSVALVVEYHFYTAIAAIMLVVALAIGYLPKLIHKQYWVPLVMAGVLGGLIALAPMGVCLIKGIPFQESMEWATSVIKGEQWVGSESDYLTILEQRRSDSGELPTQDYVEQTGTDEDDKPATIGDWVRKIYNAAWHFGELLLYGTQSAVYMVFCMIVAVLAACLFAVFRRTKLASGAYIALSLYTLFMVIMGRSLELGIISLMAESRASVFIQPFLFLLFAIPADILFRVIYLCRAKVVRAIAAALSIAVCVAAGYAIIKLEWFHNYFDLNLAYYNEPEYIVRNIKKEFPRLSYTVVSPTEEYYEVVDYGFHTELSEFVHMVDGGMAEYTFPSRYVFFFIEKYVLQDYYEGQVYISPEYARREFVYMTSSQDYYFQRAILESKAYYWAQQCLRIYPNSFSLYYEDDIYVVYLLEQNVNYPYDLRFDYLSALPEPQEQPEEQEGTV